MVKGPRFSPQRREGEREWREEREGRKGKGKEKTRKKLLQKEFITNMSPWTPGVTVQETLFFFFLKRTKLVAN